MKKLLITLVCACLGLSALSASHPAGNAMTEQLQAMSLSGYVRLGDVDANGWVPVEYVGTENVTISATVNGSNVSIVNHRIKLPYYGTHVVVVTVKATGYATLTVTYDDVTWKQDIPNSPFMVVLLDRFGNEQYYDLMPSPPDFFNLIDVPTKVFGDSIARFYYLIEGVAFGASDEDTPAFLGDAFQNPLYECRTTPYTIPAGYSYFIGFHVKMNLDYEIEGYYALLTRGGPVVDPTYLRGDVDGDKAVTIADVASLIDYLLSGNVQIDRYNADVDDSGSISINDVTELIDMMLH